MTTNNYLTPSHTFMLPAIFYILIISSTIFLYVVCPKILIHGHTDSLLSKNLYITFYVVSIIYFYLRAKWSFFIIHLVRRSVECLLFRYKTSKMNILQYIFGILYYIVLSHYLSKINLRITKTFLFLNCTQFVSHYMVFRRKWKYLHYISEIFIHLHIFMKIRSFVLMLNTIWVILFVIVTIRLRKIAENKNKIS